MVRAKIDEAVTSRNDVRVFRKDIFSLLLIGIVPRRRLRFKAFKKIFFIAQTSSESFGAK